MNAPTGSTVLGRRPLTPAARRLLSAASDLFYERGLTAVGVELVAERAGTTKKTLYDRFGSKEGLVVAYLEERAERWQEHAEAHLRAVATEPPGADRPLHLLDALETWMARWTRGCGFVNAYAELSGSSPAALTVIRAEKAWVRERYTTLAAEARFAGPDLLGRRLAVVHEGAVVEATAGGSETALDDARSVMRMLTGGAA